MVIILQETNISSEFMEVISIFIIINLDELNDDDYDKIIIKEDVIKLQNISKVAFS